MPASVLASLPKLLSSSSYLGVLPQFSFRMPSLKTGWANPPGSQ